MDGVEEAEDVISVLREEVEFLEETIADYVDERLFDIALSILRRFQTRRSQGFAGDSSHWPYVGDKHDSSFAAELFHVFKQEGYSRHYRSDFALEAAHAHQNLSNAEKDLLAVACFPKDRESATLAEQTEFVRSAIVSKMVTILRDYDSDVLLPD